MDNMISVRWTNIFIVIKSVYGKKSKQREREENQFFLFPHLLGISKSRMNVKRNLIQYKEDQAIFLRVKNRSMLCILNANLYFIWQQIYKWDLILNKKYGEFESEN